MKYQYSTVVALLPVCFGLGACTTPQTTQPAVVKSSGQQWEAAAIPENAPYVATPEKTVSPALVGGGGHEAETTASSPPLARQPQEPASAAVDISPFASSGELELEGSADVTDLTAEAAPVQESPDDSSESVPPPDGEARVFLEGIKSSAGQWKQLLNRFDANRDNEIDAREYARYKEWHGKRIRVKEPFDLDGDGRIDPGRGAAFRAAVKSLNETYFVTPE